MRSSPAAAAEFNSRDGPIPLTRAGPSALSRGPPVRVWFQDHRFLGEKQTFRPFEDASDTFAPDISRKGD